MADLIQLEQTANQQFSIPLGDHNYDIRIFSIDGHMACDISIDGLSVISGFKLTNEVLLIPYEYQEVNGNLLLSISEDEIPDYERFGSSQFLYYLDADETAQYRAAFEAGLDYIPEDDE